MSERIKKVNETIKRELGKIVLEEIDLPKDVLLTITQVDVSKDLRQAKVFISVFPENKIEQVLQILNKDIYNLQQSLNKLMKIKYVPKIIFIEDKDLKRAQNIDKVLENIEK